MKSLAATLILLSCLLALSVINYHHVNGAVREMEQRLDALPPVGDPLCPRQSEAICAYWERQARMVELTVSYPFVDRVCEQAALLAACAAVGDAYGFYSAKALLYDALNDLARAERVSLESLL